MIELDELHHKPEAKLAIWDGAVKHRIEGDFIDVENPDVYGLSVIHVNETVCGLKTNAIMRFLTWRENYADLPFCQTCWPTLHKLQQEMI